MSNAQTRMASLKYKLSLVSQGIGMLICLQLRGCMKGITGIVDSRRSSNAPWSEARREYVLGRLLNGAMLPSSCLHATQAQPTVQIWSRTGPGVIMIRKYDTKFVCGMFLCWLLENRQYLTWCEAYWYKLSLSAFLKVHQLAGWVYTQPVLLL